MTGPFFYSKLSSIEKKRKYQRLVRIILLLFVKGFSVSSIVVTNKHSNTYSKLSVN